MDSEINIKNMISDEILNDLESLLLHVYDLVESGNTTELDSNYTFSTNLYGKLLPAIKRYAKSCSSVEDLSGHGRAILKMSNFPLYLRFINDLPSDYRRKKCNNKISDMFSLTSKTSSNYDLFEDLTNQEEPKFGFFFFNRNSESDNSPYVRLQIFDEFWNLLAEWSSDSIENHISLSFDETPKDLPAAKPLISGDERLTRILPTEDNMKKKKGE